MLHPQSPVTPRYPLHPFTPSGDLSWGWGSTKCSSVCQGGSKIKIWPHLRALSVVQSSQEELELPGTAGTQGGCCCDNKSCMHTDHQKLHLFGKKYSVIVHLELPKARLEQPPGREFWVRQSVGHFHIPKGLFPMPTLCPPCPLALP